MASGSASRTPEPSGSQATCMLLYLRSSSTGYLLRFSFNRCLPIQGWFRHQGTSSFAYSLMCRASRADRLSCPFYTEVPQVFPGYRGQCRADAGAAPGYEVSDGEWSVGALAGAGCWGRLGSQRATLPTTMVDTSGVRWNRSVISVFRAGSCLGKLSSTAAIACCIASNVGCHLCKASLRRYFHSRSIRFKFGEYPGRCLKSNVTPLSFLVWSIHARSTLAC